MQDKELEKFRHALNEHKNTLLNWLTGESNEQGIQLGGAGREDVERMLSELRQVLSTLENGEFGKCQECNGEVETERLEADYSTCVCLSHYSNQQLRSLENELELVSRVQRDLLPCTIPVVEGLDLFASSQFAGPVGGDYYDFFKFKDARMGLTIADVMDKGLPASMLMANLQASVRILGPQFRSPQDLSHHLNHLFECNLNLIKFISIINASIDMRTKVIEYCNAGHHPPLYWSATVQQATWLAPTGPAIGLTRQPSYSSRGVSFSSGDIFVFYTDGLVEAKNREDDEFGEERLLQAVRAHADKSAREIHDTLFHEAHDFAVKFEDDATLMVLKIAQT